MINDKTNLTKYDGEKPRCKQMYINIKIYSPAHSLKYTIFVHVHGVRSGGFGLRAGVDLTRPQFTRVVHHLSFLLLGLRSGHRSEGEEGRCKYLRRAATIFQVYL